MRGRCDGREARLGEGKEFGDGWGSNHEGRLGTKARSGGRAERWGRKGGPDEARGVEAIQKGLSELEVEWERRKVREV